MPPSRAAFGNYPVGAGSPCPWARQLRRYRITGNQIANAVPCPSFELTSILPP